MNFWRAHKNLIILFITTVIGILLGSYEPFQAFLLNLKGFGYLGAFIAGILFVSTFTFATGTIVLLILAEGLNPFLLALVAGAGGVLGDYLIFKFIKDDLGYEVKVLFSSIYEKIYSKIHFDFGSSYFKNLVQTKYFGWTLPVIGAILIASPIPDEVGITLMGISKMPTWKFLSVAFVLDAIGVFIVISLSTVIKP